MLISAPISPSAVDTFGQSKAGTNATTTERVETSQVTTQSLSPDQMAEEMRGQVRVLQSHVETVNRMNEYLDSGYRPPNISDEAYAGYLKDLTQMRDGLVESVKARSQMLATDFSVSGDLPSKQADGTWSHGSFTVSTSGKGFGIRSDTYGNMTMSRNGTPYVSWSASEFALSAATSAANVALQVMGITSLNLKI